MTVLDIFWIFFMLSALQPVIRQRMLDAMRMRKIAQLERERNSRVILLVHRQETMKLLGFPVMRYIDVNDSEEVLRAIQMTGHDVPLDIVLHTPGGSSSRRCRLPARSAATRPRSPCSYPIMRCRAGP
jgi:ClpP class serine protease